MNQFRRYAYKVSKNQTRTVWVLKCDIKKFFASVDHEILLSILAKHISDRDILWLLENVITSFHTTEGRGLPLGNLTSQLLVNVYLHEFDQCVKHKLKQRYYTRYADDFVFLHHDKRKLQGICRYIDIFLAQNLKLHLHPDKVFIKTLASGVDFLGWVHFPDHLVLRTATKRRVLKRMIDSPCEAIRASYSGMLNQGNTQKLRQMIQLWL